MHNSWWYYHIICKSELQIVQAPQACLRNQDEENEEPSRKITEFKCREIKTALLSLPQLTIRLNEARL
jgi:hypothetical protein